MAELHALPKLENAKLSDGKYRAAVFDLDGTLYNQRKLRMIMAARLLMHYLLHPFQIREVLILKTFRQVREKWTGSGEDVARLQYEAVGEKHHVSAAEVEKIVKRWIYDDPLNILPKCADTELAGYIRSLRTEHIPVFIFSDYPIEEKLHALGLDADGMYAPGDERNMELKPSPMGLNLIMEEQKLARDEIFLVGDRDVKDGEAARRAGVDYYLIKR